MKLSTIVLIFVVALVMVGQQPMNQTQLAGTAVSVNNGATDGGTARVTISNDSTGQIKTTNFPTTVDTNTGNAGASTPRSVVATNNPAIANWGHGATGGAVPANATYLGGNSSGNLTGIIACDSYASLDMTTATTTQIVALTSSQTIYVCSFSIETNGTSTVTMKYGTGSNCGTGTTSLSPAWDFTAQTGISRGSGLGMVMKVPSASNALCVTNSAAVNTHVEVTYTKF